VATRRSSVGGCSWCVVEAGGKVAEVAHDLWIGVQTICNWRCQDRIDRGLETGMSSAEKAELAAARKRIRELEAGVAVHRRATSCSRKNADPKAVRGMCSLL
jgi:transposase-like protein